MSNHARLLFPLLLLLATCRTGPGDLPDTLVIVPDSPLIRVGADLQLSAWLTSPSEKRRAANSVSWATSNPGIASVSEHSGIVTALSNGRAEISAATPGQRVVTTVRILPDFSGRWSLDVVAADCVRLSGEGTNVCRFAIGFKFAEAVELQQMSLDVSGTVERPGVDGLSGMISGTISAADELIASGRTELPRARSSSIIHNFVAVRTAAVLTGTYQEDSSFTNPFGPQVLRYTKTFSGRRAEPK